MNTKKKSTAKFKEEIKELFAGHVACCESYKGALIKIRFRCSVGHSFVRSPSALLRSHAPNGCFLCCGNRKTHEQFTAELLALKKPFELLDVYTKDVVKVRVRCTTCSLVWRQTPNTLLYQKTCPECAKAARCNQPNRVTQKEFLRRVEIKNPLLTVTGGEYERLSSAITVTCKSCGHEKVFSAERLMYLSLACGVCTPSLNRRQYSKVSILWLEHESRTRRIVITHAENGGEFRIPGTRYKADGYNKRSNTIFEFLGDYWHTDSKDKVLKSTKKKFSVISKLGYNIVYIWHSQFNKGLEASVYE